MAKLTKVFGAIMTFVGSIIVLYTFFVYLNSSAHLNYNVEKQPSLAQVKLFYPFLVGFVVLGLGILFAKDRVLEENH